MTSEEIKEMTHRIHRGLDMVSEKAEKIGKEKSEWSLCELGQIADIEKDIAKTLKYLIKIHIMTEEHSIEKY